MFWATGLPGWARLGWFPGAARGVYGGSAPYGAAAYTPTVSKEAEPQALQGQADYFRSALEGIQKRVDELEAEGEKDE